MARKTQVAVIATLIAMFCIGVLGYWIIGLIEQQAILFEDDTLQKLTFGADINSNQAEGYARILLAFQADTDDARDRYFADARDYERKNDTSIELYRNSITDNQTDSLRILDEMIVLRERYRENADAAIGLLTSHQLEAAHKLANDSLWPAYRRYTIEGDVLLANDVAVGKERARTMRALTIKVKFIAATLCILVFLVGLSAPFLFLVSVANWMDDGATTDRGY